MGVYNLLEGKKAISDIRTQGVDGVAAQCAEHQSSDID